MSSRVTDLSSSRQLIDFMLATQRRMQAAQLQVGSEKKSQDYKGISSVSERLVDMENTRVMLERYTQVNQLMELTVKVTDTALEGIKQAAGDFRELLFEFAGGSTDEQSRVEGIQDAAIRTLIDLEVYLNTDVNGKYVFSGTRTDTEPVALGLSDKATFQTAYDGETIIYPPTRDAHVLTSVSLGNADTGNLTISGTDTITAATAGSLSSIAVGSTITLGGSVLGNDANYTVVSNDGTNLTISGAMSAGVSTLNVTNTIANGAETAATLSVSNYYNGDTQSVSHRLASNRDFSIDLNALDPAFEKLIRGISIIAQGSFGTNGGLDQNQYRVDDALTIINDALQPYNDANPPYGTEATGNIPSIEITQGYYLVQIAASNDHHNTLLSFYEAKSAELENADPVEAISLMMAESRTLEASYTAIARIQQLNLTSFI